MHEDVPDNFRRAAIYQLISGLVNMFVLPVIVVFGGAFCGIFTFGLAWICMGGACILVPVGILEVASGALSLSQPEQSGQLMRFATYAEFGSILGGGLHSAVVGYVVTNLLDDAEVRAFIEHNRQLPV